MHGAAKVFFNAGCVETRTTGLKPHLTNICELGAVRVYYSNDQHEQVPIKYLGRGDTKDVIITTSPLRNPW